MKYIYTLLLSFFIIGCSNNSEPIDQFAELSDLELIELIKSAEDKQEISINDLPDISQYSYLMNLHFQMINFHLQDFLL